MQAAAECDVHFLETAADSQERDANSNGGSDQRESDAVPVRVLQYIRRMRQAAIEGGFHIRGASGQDHAIQASQQVADIVLRPVGGDKDRKSPDDLRYRPDIGVRRGVGDPVLVVKSLLAAGDSDQWRHGECR